jgi:integrase
MNRGAVWAMLFTSLLSSVLICLGALLPSRRVRAGARWPLTVYGATAAVAVVGTVPMVVFPGMLPRPDLRHTVASLLIAGGANITFLSRQLGHSSSQISLTVYAHLLDGEAQAERTREMLQEMLGDVV